MSKTCRILAFGAHAADVADLAGGTVANYARRGAEIMMVALSLGAKSHVLVKGELDKLRETKRREMEEAYKVLGVSCVRSLEYEEDPLILGRKEISDLVEIIREFRTSLVLTHHPTTDTVPDHNEAGRAVWHACHCAGRPGFTSSRPVHIVGTLFAYWAGVNIRAERILGAAPPLPTLYIDISAVIETKIQAMEKFESQQYTREYMKRSTESIEQHYGMEAGVNFAEPFYSLRSLVLSELPISYGEVNPGRSVEGLEQV